MLIQWRERLGDHDVETVDRVNKRHLANYAKYLSRQADAGKGREVDGGISAAMTWIYYDYVSAFLS